IESGHTRIPVFDKTRDDIVGILYSKDLLPEFATGDPNSRTPLRSLVRKPLFVPESEAVEEIELIDDDTCEALGRAHIDEINEAMDLELPEDGDYDTIGGLVFSELGRIPQAGES